MFLRTKILSLHHFICLQNLTSSRIWTDDFRNDRSLLTNKIWYTMNAGSQDVTMTEWQILFMWLQSTRLTKGVRKIKRRFSFWFLTKRTIQNFQFHFQSVFLSICKKTWSAVYENCSKQLKWKQTYLSRKPIYWYKFNNCKKPYP